MRALAAGLALGLALVLGAGCSQTAALAPVGGDRLAEVRFAAIDVLLDRGVELAVAPVCTASGPDDGTIDCTGTAEGDRPVVARSTADDHDRLVVTVAGEVVHDGSLREVLTAAARPAP